MPETWKPARLKRQDLFGWATSVNVAKSGTVSKGYDLTGPHRQWPRTRQAARLLQFLSIPSCRPHASRCDGTRSDRYATARITLVSQVISMVLPELACVLSLPCQPLPSSPADLEYGKSQGPRIDDANVDAAGSGNKLPLTTHTHAQHAARPLGTQNPRRPAPVLGSAESARVPLFCTVHPSSATDS